MKKIILSIMTCLISSVLFSQEQGEIKYQQYKHELSIWGAGGMSTLYYDLSLGDREKWNFGYMAGLGYSFYFNYNWGFGTGLELSALKSSLKLGDFTDNYYSAAFGGMDNPLYLSVRGTDYDEDYNALYVNIPILAKYQVDVFKYHKFYVNGGLKIGIPVKGSYSSTGSYKALAYDIDSNGQPIGDAMSGFHGLGTVSYVDVDKKDFDLKTNLILSLETGMKWRLNDQFSLYSGLFVDYGLLDIRKGDNNSRVAYYTEEDMSTYTPTTSPILKSVYGINDKKYADKVSTLSAGIKLQLAFGMKQKIGRNKKPVIESKGYEGITPEEVEQILRRNVDILAHVIEDNFDALSKKLEKESPELFEPIPTDDIESIVQFDLDKNDLKKIYLPDIDRKIAILKKYPEVKMTLIGHTDNSGSENYNYELGLRRAQAIKEYMVQRGISPDRLSVESKGDLQPIVPNDTADNRYKNRRVEFKIRKYD